MQMSSGLLQEMKWRMAISQSFKQSIDILQMSGYELLVYLHEQSLENPLLEIEWETARAKRRLPLTSEQFDPFWNLRSKEETLEQHLVGQLRMLSLGKQQLAAASYLAGNLDDAGYLSISLDEASAMLGQSPAQVLQALELLQSLDPAGVGARSLKECLLLQISRDPDPDPWAYPIVEHWLPEVAQGKLDKIASALKISLSEANRSLAYIRSLNPRPGSAYAPEEKPWVTPDAIIEKLNDQYIVHMTNGQFPKISINPCYEQYLAAYPDHKELCAFLKKKRHEAEWLLSSIHQRKNTLFRVMEYLVQEQREFFDHGVTRLKPITLRMIADHLGFHESTISRAIQSKYIQTPQGVYELKYFLSRGLNTNEGESVSAKAIKSKIKDMVQRENKRKPLSDQVIAEMLVAEGIQISRRTVTKYREEMRILSTVHRKQRI